MSTCQRSPAVFEVIAVSMMAFALLSAGAPASPTYNFQQVTESNSSRLEWSLVTGTRTLLFYTASTREPPIVTTENDNILQIIETICDLLMHYELMSKVDGAGDLLVILRQNLMDACNWIRALNTTGVVSIDQDVAVNCSCLPEDVTFLHTHCARTNLSPTITDASFLIGDYLQDAVKDINHCTWIERAIPTSHQNTIKSYLSFCF